MEPHRLVDESLSSELITCCDWALMDTGHNGLHRMALNVLRCPGMINSLNTWRIDADTFFL
jgi:hypothetical protein